MPAKTRKAGNAQSTSSKPPPTQTKSLQDVKPTPPQPATSKTPNDPSVEVATNSTPKEGAGQASQVSENSASQPAVNRKKQKRREKEAAKRAAEQQAEDQSQNGRGQTSRGTTSGRFREEPDYINDGFLDETVDVDDAFYSGAEDQMYGEDELLRNGYQHMEQIPNGTTGKKKRRGKRGAQGSNLPQHHDGNPSSMPRNPARPHLPSTPSLSAAALRSAHQRFSHDQIWNTSTQAERENIKQFWLELGEEERRSLVKVEKEAVLRKMKEQQKHSCSCTVCGRKRTAIEEELEVLYDAYYEELEQFANHNNDLTNGTAIISDPRSYGHLRTHRHPMAGQFPMETTGQDPLEDEDDLDDDEYDEDEEPYSDDDIEEIPRGPPDFFTFGNSLTVKGTWFGANIFLLTDCGQMAS
jgi:Salt tolerance down-regulator